MQLSDNELDGLIEDCLWQMEWSAIFNVFKEFGFTYAEEIYPVSINSLKEIARINLERVVAEWKKSDSREDFEYSVSSGRFTAYGFVEEIWFNLRLEFIPFSSESAKQIKN
jgi:hypothetical protein